MGAAELDIVRMLVRQIVQSLVQFGGGVDKRVQCVDDCEFAGRGIRVVRGLRMVDMVVGVDEFVVATRSACQFERTIGNDLVHIHIGRRARTSLQHVHRELVGEFAVFDFQTRLLN